MLKRKTTIFLLAALLMASACGFFCLAPWEVRAAETALSPEDGGASLFLPVDYENYLDLSSPSSVAIGERYTAVADGKKIYVYDHSNPSEGYRVWEHKKETPEVTVGKMQFTDDNRLFFSSASGLFELTLEGALNETQVSSDFNPYTFLISGDILYAVTVSEGTATILYRFKMDSKTFALANATVHQTVLNSSSSQSSPLLAHAGGTVYCSLNGTVYKYDEETLEGGGNFSLDSAASGVLTPGSVCAQGDHLYFTDEAGLHLTDTSGKSDLLVKAEGLNALYPRGDLLYCLWGKAVRAYDTVENKFTDYEISSASSSVGRLSGATDIVRAGSLVVIADTENNRVTVYNSETNAYSVLAPEDETFSPVFVATDGTMVAAATTDKVYVCNDPMKDPKFAEPVAPDRGEIKGIACVYGSVYYVTQNGMQGKIGGDPVTKSNGTPAAMTSDLYGNFYVAYTDESVRSFTEEQFVAQGEDGTTVEGVTIPNDAKSLRADFEGGLYYLDSEGTFCGKNGAIATVNGASFVYLGEGSASPTAFALGYEDDEVYFLFKDYIVKSTRDKLGFPTFGQLSEAKDIVRAGDLLVTADTGNSRVTVYDMQKRSFAVIQTNFSPTLVATDGSVITAACGNKVYVCDYGDECFGEPTTADIGTIKGLACVHGSVYYITEYGYGKVEEEDFGLVSRLEGSLEALAADANGILYVVDSNGHVRYFYEEEFIDPAIMSGADAGFTLHMPISSLRADCNGNLYYIHENKIWKNETPFSQINDSLLVYGDEGKLVSFALGFEDDEVFLLYGNRMIKTAPGALDIPFLDRSDAFDSRQDILPPNIRKKKS